MRPKLSRLIESYSKESVQEAVQCPVQRGAKIQRFSEIPDQVGMSILSVIPENLLLWAFLMQNINFGITKMSVIPENLVFPNPVQ